MSLGETDPSGILGGSVAAAGCSHASTLDGALLLLLLRSGGNSIRS